MRSATSPFLHLSMYCDNTRDSLRFVEVHFSRIFCQKFASAFASSNFPPRRRPYCRLLGLGRGMKGPCPANRFKLQRSLRTKLNGECNVLAYDARGHGASHGSRDTVLSLDQLSMDLCALVTNLYPDLNTRGCLLVGHRCVSFRSYRLTLVTCFSMGGPVIANIAAKRLLPNVRGIVVVDVVEGTALQALSGMTALLSKRPTAFPTLTHAIQWR